MSKAAGLLVVGLLLSAVVGHAQAQVFFLPIDSPSSTLTENFNGMGALSNAELPHGWRIGVTAEFFISKSATTESAGTAGFGALTVNSPDGLYNFADGENATSTDRSVGFLTGPNLTSFNKHLHLGLTNNTGSTINDVSFSYDIEKYRSGTRSDDIKLFYGFDGVVWTEIPAGLAHYDADPATAVVNPPTSIHHSLELSNLNLADQSHLFIRWNYTAVVANNCQALGIDNFQLNVGPLQQPDLQWDGAPGASWDTAAMSWKNSAGTHMTWNDNIPNNASFVDGGVGVGNAVTLSSPRKAGRITFDAGAKSYTLSGSSLQITGAGGTGIIARSSAAIQSDVQVTSSQTWEITSNLTLTGQLTLNSNVTLTKKGSGSLLLGGSQNHGSNSQLKMTEGTLHLSANLGPVARLAIVGNANATNATVILDSDQDVLELAIATADPGLQGLNLSSPPSPGAFRSLRVHSPDLASAKTALFALIRQARQTPGDGIYDSSLPAHPSSALGVAAINDYILIRPTRIGDLNLDGLVTISDFIDLASNFNATNKTWQEGDLNGDGLVSISDFIDLASNFGQSYAGEITPILPSDQQALNEFAAAHGTAVPEPSLVLVGLLVSLAACRRNIKPPPKRTGATTAAARDPAWPQGCLPASRWA